MNDPDFVESIHRELDGMNNESESRELQDRLRFDPEAMELYRGLQAVSDALSGLEELEPPASLRPDLKRAIAELSAEVAAPTPPTPAAIAQGAAPIRSGALRYGWALAAGIVLGLFAAQLLPQEATDIDGISGTMAPRPAAPASATTLEPLEATTSDPWVVDGADVSGAVRLSHDGSRIAVDVDLDGAEPVYLVLTHDETVGVIGLTQDGTAVEIRESGAGHVVLGEARQHRYQVLMSRTDAGPTTLDLGLFKKDELIDEYELRVGEAE